MLRRIAFVARKEFQYYWMDWESYAWAFAVPVLFMYFIGTVTSQSGSSDPTGQKDVIGVLVPPDAGFLADVFVRRLEQNGYDVHRRESKDQVSDYTRHVIIPRHFTDIALRGEKAVVKFKRTESWLVQDYDQFRVKRAIFTILADLAVCAAKGRAPDAATFDELEKMPRSISLEVRQAGKRKQIPTGFEHAVPGVMIMFSIINVLTNASTVLVMQRQLGLLKRLTTAPMTHAEIFTGKWVARLAIGYVQVVVGLVAGTVLFGVEWGPDLFTILIVLLAWSALCASLGLLLGNLVQTEAQGISVSALGALSLCALGGQWWPIEVTPPWMQKLAMCLPTGWTMDALHQLALFHAGPSVAIPHLTALLVASAILGIVGSRTLRFV